MKVNRKKLIDHINARWANKACPMCGRNNWNIDAEMMTMLGVGEDKSINLGGKIMPMVPIICNECGNVVLVNPLVINCVDD